MLFNSLAFILFFPTVLVIYSLFPARYRWIVLLLASYFFYMWWEPSYALIIFGSTLADYLIARQIESRKDGSSRKMLVALSLLINLGVLGIFKYYNFFVSELIEALQSVGITANPPLFKLLLPVGISFYTFQTLSYTIDVYRRHIPAERHFGIFATYVAFFPQLVAGPIERYSHLGPQLHRSPNITYANFAGGFRLILFGLFTKMCVADHLAVFVDQVYAHPENYTRTALAAGIFSYSFQIYADFFGYSLVAVGAARVLGIDIIDNFKAPYLSNSLFDFWKRWHISLTAWFRSYLYIPLGGNKGSRFKWFRNILIVFLLSGLWHGANRTFLIWGLFHGLIYLMEIIAGRFLGLKLQQMPRFIRVLNGLKTFVIVSLLWVFFRSVDLEHSEKVFSALIDGSGSQTLSDINPITWIMLGLFLLFDPLFYSSRLDVWLDKQPFLLRWGTYTVLLAALLLFAAVTQQPFIYFQF